MEGHLVKRSVTLRGHRTSLALEPAFWTALDRAAREDGRSLAGLVARIDEARTGSGTPLSSAVRVWVLAHVAGNADG